MLVLARQEGDGITFPELNLEVEILRIQGSRVQVGVHAPREITILRSELMPDDWNRDGSSREDSRKSMDLQNRLRDVANLLTTARSQWEQGDLEGVEATLRSMVARQDAQPRGDSPARGKSPALGDRPPTSATHVSEPSTEYDCKSNCQQPQTIHPACPLHDVTRARAEGLAC